MKRSLITTHINQSPTVVYQGKSIKRYARSLLYCLMFTTVLSGVSLTLSLSVHLSAYAEETSDFDDQRGDFSIDQDTLDEAENAFLDGLSAYRAKRYAESAQLFKKAYSLVPFRDLHFNVARAYEELKDKSNAIKYYKLYLDAKPIDETLVIRRLRQLGVKDFRQSQASTGGGNNNVVTPKLQSTPEEKSQTLTWSVLGGGVLLVGLGTYFGIDALGQAEDARSSTSQQSYQKYKDGAEGSALLADISMSLGIVAIAGGIYLLLTEPSTSSHQAETQLDVTSTTSTSPLRWNVKVDASSTTFGLSGSF